MMPHNSLTPDIALGDAPPEPLDLNGTGVARVTLLELSLKLLFRHSRASTASFANALCLPLALTQDLIDQLRQQHLLEITTSYSPETSSEIILQLTQTGRDRALDAFARSEYSGPAPVSLADFSKQIRLQSARTMQLGKTQLTQAFNGLIVPPTLIDVLGPAIAANRSILMYGPPGNGKSTIARCIRDAFFGKVYLPHAIEHQGQIITFYDPLIHTAIPVPEDDPHTLRRSGARFDRRYVLCQRPTVTTGGELTLDMLELSYSPISKTYQAPLQMKSLGGIFIVDDLGRQAEPPQAIINRWIVPLEAGQDILSLHSGEKLLVPFDTLVIFSTNFHPRRILDEAALRRIFYKIRIDGPSQEQFLEIFATVALQRKMPLDEAALIHLIKHKYPLVDNAYANYHATFLIDQMLAICHFEDIPPQMSVELIDRAWRNLFVEESDVSH